MSTRFTATPQEIYFEVSGVSQPKKCAAYGRHFQCYNPSKLAEQEFVGVVQSLCERSLGSVPKFAADALVKVRIDFFFPCNCTSNRVERKILATADIDNLCKFVLDALNTVLYADDRQVVALSASKAFDAENTKGRTAVTLSLK